MLEYEEESIYEDQCPEMGDISILHSYSSHLENIMQHQNLIDLGTEILENTLKRIEKGDENPGILTNYKKQP
tara:strand:- start:1476 stop:1691 length:216 start_codon:yes stop_codon:yes gene_type:complete